MTAERAGGGRNRRSLRRLVTVVSTAAVLLVVLTLVIGVFSFTRLLMARSQLIDQLDPAALAARDLSGALVDQETGVRGFLLTGQEQFLEPYERGRADERQAKARLDQTLMDIPHAHEAIAAIEQLTAMWQREFAEPAIARARLGVPASQDALAESRRHFDGIRAGFAVLEATLADAQIAARARLNQSTARLLGVLVLAVASLAAIGIWTRAGFIRGVLEPLLALGSDARRVSNGELDHPVAANGPVEIAELAADVEAMRSRIVAELARTDRARAALDEQARDLARSNAELEQFAYVASHDLQEPLRKVASFCQMLQRRYAGQLDERADQYIDFAVDGAKRMQALINDLLIFSRVGRTTERFRPVDCDLALKQALRSLEAAVEETGAVVVAQPLPTVQGDLSLLSALFQNLLENAFKYRSEAPPEVRVEADVVDGEWLFSVCDNGIGIPPAYAERVFAIFERLHPKEQYPGTGIGLALCRKIVEYHGGRIWIDPHVAHGTTVRWTLPRMRDGDDNEPAARDPDRDPAGGG